MNILRSSAFLILTLFCGGVFMGCNSATGSYTSNAKFGSTIIGEIEKRSIEYEGVHRNPVIVVPGFLGSKLVNKDTGKNIWGEFTGADGLLPSDKRMLDTSFPMKYGVPLNKIVSNDVPDGVLDQVTVKILGIPFHENQYQNLVNVLKHGGYQPEGEPLSPGKHYHNLFQFGYDWRMDLPANAAKLHEFILEKRAYIQEEYRKLYGLENYNVQFDVLAHSMGGLVSRYYLRYGTNDLPPDGRQPEINWFGSKYIDRLMILGTPNAGYLDTCVELINGTKLPPYPPAVVGTFATYYQMMPAPSTNSVVYADGSGTPVDMFDIDIWRQMEWGLADPAQDRHLKTLLPNVKNPEKRRAIAIDHLDKCLKRAKQFIKAMAVTATPPPDVQLYLVLGNAVETSRRAVVDPMTKTFKVDTYAPGDGKVLKSSALRDNRAGREWHPFFSSPIDWDGIIQLRAAHMGITTDPAFEDNILFLLRAVPSKKQMEDLF